MPVTTGILPATSSRATASVRRRSARVSEATSAAWPLATRPVTPGASTSQRRCLRYAASSMARSAVNGRMLAGMQPWKRSPWIMASTLAYRSSPARQLVGQLLGREDAGVGAADDVERGALDLGPERGDPVVHH